MKRPAFGFATPIFAFIGSLFGCSSLPPGYPYRVEPHYGVDDPQFARVMGHLLGPPLDGGNTITILNNGDRIFPAMLEAIRSAQKTINFETFIYWQGEIGKEFTEALCERARAGVKVHLLIDAVSSTKIDKGYVHNMHQAGA